MMTSLRLYRMRPSITDGIEGFPDFKFRDDAQNLDVCITSMTNKSTNATLHLHYILHVT